MAVIFNEQGQPVISGGTSLKQPLLSGVTAAGAGPARAVSGESLRLEVTGTGAAALQIQGRRSGGTWYVLRVFDADYNILTAIATAGLYSADIATVDEVRANRTSAGSALTVR